MALIGAPGHGSHRGTPSTHLQLDKYTAWQQRKARRTRHPSLGNPSSRTPEQPSQRRGTTTSAPRRVSNCCDSSSPGVDANAAAGARRDRHPTAGTRTPASVTYPPTRRRSPWKESPMHALKEWMSAIALITAVLAAMFLPSAL